MTETNDKKKQWMAQRKQAIKELENSILTQVHKYAENPSDVLDLADFCSRFGKYSLSNWILIRTQRPCAIAVASFSTYRQLGYHILKGEKAMNVIQPCIYEYLMLPNGKQKPISHLPKEQRAKLDPTKIKKVIFYKTGHVFEVTQTDMPKEEYPKLYPNRHIDFQTDLNNEADFQNIWQQLIKIADEKQINVKIGTVDDEVSLNGATAQFEPATNCIVLSHKDTKTEMLDILIHELAHGYLHNLHSKFSDLPKELRELQAEMIAYIVSKFIGIDTREQTVDYISSWTSGGLTFDNLESKEQLQVLNGVTKVANHFLDVLDDKHTAKQPSTQQNKVSCTSTIA